MIFGTRVAGIPCQCRVLEYEEAFPMAVYSNGDADPPCSSAMDFELKDMQGYPAPWLEAKLTPEDNNRLLREYEELLVYADEVEPRDVDYDFD